MDYILPEEDDSDRDEEDGSNSGSGSFDSSASSSDGDDDDDSKDSGSNEEVSGSESEEMEIDEPAPRPKRAGFKEWAQRQIDMASAATSAQNDDPTAPEYPAPNLFERPAVPPPRPAGEADGLIHGPLGSKDAGVPKTSFASAVLSSTTTSAAAPHPKVPSKFVHVTRSDDIQTSRLLLPVVAEEQTIVEAIRLNPVVVICGETGSGKTTQVPQFLYEAGFGAPGSG